MMNGVVNVGMEPILQVVVHDDQGNKHPLEVTVDTGFNAFMTLPSALIQQLGLRKSGQVQVILADGRARSCPVYRAVVDWDGIPVDIEVEAAEFRPLIGTSLLRGFRLTVDMETGGTVVIEPLNRRAVVSP
jgi:clan AA aspartic protease